MSNVYFLLALIPSIILHEVSHVWLAYHCGDPTAKQMGRLTLNPLVHIDPFGSILLPIILILAGFPPFGWAKPVPVNPARMRNRRVNAFWVSLIGPMVNLTLSAIGLAMCAYAYHVDQSQFLFNAGLYVGITNLCLGVFNLIPIPPLDGSALLEFFVPNRQLPTYYRWRNKALPFVMIVWLLLSFLHINDPLFSGLINWWESLIRL